MVQRRTSSSFSILFCILYLGLSNLAFAELTLSECLGGIALEYTGLYDGVRNKPTTTTMKWCPLWAAVCSYVYRNCPSAATCEFTNYDSSITTQYYPGSSTTYLSFLSCKSCNVYVSVDPTLLFAYGIEVPTQTPGNNGHSPGSGSGSGYGYGNGNGVNDITEIGDIFRDESPADMLAEDSSATSATGAITAVLVIGSVLGSIIAVKTTSTSTGLIGTGAGASTAIANPKSGSGSGQSVVDAVTLLLHFQSISTSGLLSISYPALYRFFSYNFAWANLIIASDGFKDAIWSMGADPYCLRELGSLRTSDAYAPSGMNVVGVRYGLDRATIGGLVYLSAIIGFAIALTVFVLISVVLRILNAISKSTTLQAQVEIWPSRASSMTLRLFIWVLGSISTFAIYQFVDPCSSSSLIAFASVELTLIILTLLMVSTFIIKIAKAQGPESLFPLSESEESKYSRKWGSLYGQLKPSFYWFFIPDYVWVFAKSMIVGLGQGSGISQVSALIGLEFATLIALLKRPYATSSGNAFHIFSTCKRLVASATLLVFWDGFRVPTNIKRTIGIILMAVESAYAVALFVALLLNSGAKIVKWNTERKERRRGSGSEPRSTMSSPLAPNMHHTSSDYSNVSAGQEKTY